MPELPEVETVKNVLKPHLIGRTITAVTVNNSSVIARSSAEEFVARLQGQTFTDFTRQGKFLTLHFESGDSTILHLRMTGCLTIEPQNTPCEKHTHVVFALDDGNELRYEDIRRFGKFWYIENGTPDTLTKQNFIISIDNVNLGFLRPKRIRYRACKGGKKRLLFPGRSARAYRGVGLAYAGYKPCRPDACGCLRKSRNAFTQHDRMGGRRVGFSCRRQYDRSGI